MASNQDFTKIEKALKRGAKSRRSAPLGIALGLPSLGSLSFAVWPIALVFGASMTFLIPDQVWTKRYAKADVIRQIARRGEERIESTPFALVSADPFPESKDYDYALTITDGHYEASSSFTGSFFVRDGAIYPEEDGEVIFLNLRESGRQATSDYLPGFLQNMMGDALTEGRGLNIKVAVTDRISDIPIFYVPPADQAMFAENRVLSVAATDNGFVVKGTDGLTKTDALHFIVMIAGVIGVGRRLF